MLNFGIFRSICNVEDEESTMENVTVVELENSLAVTSVTTVNNTNSSKDNGQVAVPSTSQAVQVQETFESRKHIKKVLHLRI